MSRRRAAHRARKGFPLGRKASVSAIAFASIAVDLQTRKTFQLHWLLAISLVCPPVTICSLRFSAVTRVIVSATAKLTCRRTAGLRRSSPAANLEGRTLKGAQERHQVLLLLCGQLVAQDQIEEFDGIVQRQQTLVMQVGRVVLDPAQGEGLDAARRRPPSRS